MDFISEDEIIFQEEPHAYTYRGKQYLSVTDRLRAAGLQEDFSSVPPERMEWYLRRGQMVHLACEYADKGVLDFRTVHPAIEGFVRGHLKMLEEQKPKVIALEKKLIVPSLNVAGRPDAVYWIRGRRAMVDRKSGNNRKKRNGHVQTGGYKVIWDANFPRQPIHDRYIEKLFINGTYKLEPCLDPMDVQAFIDTLKWGEINDRMNYWRQHYGNRTDDNRHTGHQSNGAVR